MPYIYRVSRRTLTGNIGSQPAQAGAVVPTPEPEPEPEVSYQEEATELAIPAPELEGPSYRDLQAQAKALDISAKQTADALKRAIAEANPDE